MSAPTLDKAPATLWSQMPGWGIAADLIPPELINARRIKILRRQIVAALVLLVIVCAGGFYLAAREKAASADELAAVQDETIRLQGEGRQYAGVVQMQAATGQIDAQLAKLMVADVDVVALIGNLRASLPATMTINQQTIDISAAGVAAGATATGGLDTSGLPIIGTITLTGTGQSLDDLSAFADQLQKVPGLVDVLPVSNILGADGLTTNYTLTMSMTNVLLTHRFDEGK